MLRLISGISIYLTVVALLSYASGTEVAETSIAGAAVTAPSGAVKQADASAFDLAALGAEAVAIAAPGGDEAIRRPETGSAWNPVLDKERKRMRGPAVNYRAGLGGPVIELGLLGGTVKPRQRLAHLALDWNF